MIITIDGGAGSGKSSAAKALSLRLGIPYFDTGAMFRALTWLLLYLDIDLDDGKKVEEILQNYPLKITDDGRYFVGDLEATDFLRDFKVTATVSAVSAISVVRTYLLLMQRTFGRQNSIFDGRDMGTVVFPDAEVKIFLKADIKTRAVRRFKEFPGKSLEEIEHDIAARDKLDSERKIAPLRPAEDAHVIDTSGLSREEVVERIVDYVKEKTKR